MTEQEQTNQNNNIGEQKTKEENRDTKNSENVVFVGNKPLVNYIKSVLMQFNKQNADEVIIKSRGKFISKAVDVAEVSRRTLEKKNVKIADIKITSESFEKDSKITNISAMDIVLRK